jgi:hypothetical protein
MADVQAKSHIFVMEVCNKRSISNLFLNVFINIIFIHAASLLFLTRSVEPHFYKIWLYYNPLRADDFINDAENDR